MGQAVLQASAGLARAEQHSCGPGLHFCGGSMHVQADPHESFAGLPLRVHLSTARLGPVCWHPDWTQDACATGTSQKLSMQCVRTMES